MAVFTHRGSTRTPLLVAESDGGSFSTGRGMAQLSGLAGPLDYSAAGGYFQTQGQVPNDFFLDRTFSGNFGLRLAERIRCASPCAAIAAMPASPDRSSSLRRPSTSSMTCVTYRRASAGISPPARIGASAFCFENDITVRSNSSDAGEAGQILFTPPSLDEHNDQHDISAGLSWDFSTGPHWQHRLFGFETDIHELFANPFSATISRPIRLTSAHSRACRKRWHRHFIATSPSSTTIRSIAPASRANPATSPVIFPPRSAIPTKLRTPTSRISTASTPGATIRPASSNCAGKPPTVLFSMPVFAKKTTPTSARVASRASEPHTRCVMATISGPPRGFEPITARASRNPASINPSEPTLLSRQSGLASRTEPHDLCGHRTASRQ